LEIAIIVSYLFSNFLASLPLELALMSYAIEII